MKNFLIFIGIAVGALAGIVGVVFIATREGDVSIQTETDARPNTYTIEQVPIETLADIMPDLNREIRFSESIPADIRMILSKRVSETVVRLTEDPSRGEEWLELGLLYHSANDYDGAREVWEFLVEVSPTLTIAYDNLGKLYHYSLRDYPRAEALFKQSLEVNPRITTPWVELFMLYRYSYKTESSLAADTLTAALGVLPDELDFYALLGEYQHERGNVVEARRAFEQGLARARAVNDTGRIVSFSEELVQLKGE